MRVFKASLAAVAVACTLLATVVLLLLGMTHAAETLNTARNDQVYQVLFHLKRAHSEAEIDKTFWDIATPGSSRYRKFLTHEEVRELHAAPRSVLSSARNYLETEAGCTKVEQLRTDDALVCTLDKKSKSSLKMAASVEAKFATVEVENARVGVADILPHSIQKLVRTAVAYRNALPKTAPKKNVGFAGMTQTPVTINRRYKVPSSNMFPKRDPTIIGAVAEFEGSYFLASDMTSFAQKNNLNRYNIEVMGPNTQGGGAGNVEGELDLQYMGSIFNATQPILWAAGNTDNTQPGEIDFSSWIDKVIARSNVPAVLSVSWGLATSYYDSDMNVVYTDNDAFRKAGMSGITLLAASGDSGTGDRRGTFQCKKFNPSWPASSPYLTSVGATYANSESEGEVSLDWTGSGFSDHFARPSYQEEQVSHYLRTNGKLPKSSFYNASGRAYPDVAALGSNFEVTINGNSELVSGTSAASPTFAGVLTLIAAERAAAGKSRMGFLNPTLYKIGKVGYDVVSGQNQDKNCVFGVIEGFAAQEGWDAVSGLGTPDYEFLRQNL